MDQVWTETERLALPDGATTPLQQHPTYGAACAMLGSAVRAFAVCGPHGGSQGAALVLERRVPLLGAAALLSRGPVWTPDTPPAVRQAGLEALLDQLRRTYRVVAVTPETCGGADPLDHSGMLRAMSPCHLARLDLSVSEAAMRARQNGKWRNRLVKAEAAGLTVRHSAMPEDVDHWLLRAEAEQARQRRYRRLPPEFTLAWVRKGGKRAARLFTAEAGGVPVAAMLFLLHGKGATYHIGWSGPLGRACGAHNLLLWQAQLWLARRDVTTLDLDLVDTETTPGLARFKIGSGADVVPLGATRIIAPGSGLFAERSRFRRPRSARKVTCA